MLVVFAAVPAAAPFEAVLGEDLESEVRLVDLHREVTAAVYIGGSGGGLDGERAVHHFDIGVVERIDVDRRAHAMLGDFCRVGDEAEIEGGTVVVCHRAFIIGIVVVHETDLLNGILGSIELFEDGKDGFCDAAVHHHFAALRVPVEIHIADAEKGEVFAGDGAVIFE